MLQVIRVSHALCRSRSVEKGGFPFDGMIQLRRTIPISNSRSKGIDQARFSLSLSRSKPIAGQILMYVHLADRRTAEVNEPRERTNANHLVYVRVHVHSPLLLLLLLLVLPVRDREKSGRENADSVTNVKLKTKRNICFLSSSLRRALINKLVVERTDLFPLLILDERVSDRIYANQLSLCISFLNAEREREEKIQNPLYPTFLSLCPSLTGSDRRTSFIRNFRFVDDEKKRNVLLMRIDE